MEPNFVRKTVLYSKLQHLLKLYFTNAFLQQPKTQASNNHLLGKKTTQGFVAVAPMAAPELDEQSLLRRLLR